MPTVTISIGPKTYSVACADGEEAHITALGEMVAEKYARLGSARAPLEAQNLLFSALFLADELAEARKQIAAAPKTARKAAPTQALGTGEDTNEISSVIAEKLEAMANSAEASAAALEAWAANA